MCIILDTDKLVQMNNMIMEISGFLDGCWRYAMEHSDTRLKTVAKPVKPDKKG